jgi:CheY-like chemotaxis protein
VKPDETIGKLAPLAVPARPARVLLAEDNHINQVIAVRLLGKAGHRVTVVETGRAAVEASAREPFDIVLMDLQMPDMGGFEAARLIRARERVSGGHVRIVAMTAHAMAGDRERCLAAGMDGHLTKPVDPRALSAAVNESVQRSDEHAFQS